MSEDSDYVCTLDQASIKKAKEELNENPQDRMAAVQAMRDWVREQPHIKCPSLEKMSEDSDYVCTLDQASIKKAKEELNENPQDRMAAVQAMRDWVREQPHIKCPSLDTKTMLHYLRGFKFSQLRAREMFEKMLTLQSANPEWYGDIDTHDPRIIQIITNGLIISLPKRTPQGNTIVVQRFNILNLGKVDPFVMFRTFKVIFEYLMMSEMNQVNGFVFLLDFTGVGPKLMAKLMNKEFMDVWATWRMCSPRRSKAIHFYNAGRVFEALMTFATPLRTKKSVDRTITHDTLETVYKHIPMKCLPAEYLPDDYTGPNAGSLTDLTSDFIEEIKKDVFRQMVLYKSSTAFGINNSKCHQQTITEHFRKLNVD